jgi:molybdopterin converting factor small subunit
VNIEILCFGAMKEFLPRDADGSSATFELSEGATVADGIDALGAPKRLVHAILVNEDPADLARALKDGDRLTLMPHYSGGGA